MKNLNYKKVKGYVEGYYGKLLSWKERIEILNVLARNKMNFYFYCPKEDLNHRLNWKKPYSDDWLKNFYKFNTYAQEKKIKVIFGIAPGLDFDFQSYANGSKIELDQLVKKFKKFLSFGVAHVAILFDDIPNDFRLKVKNEDEGTIHAEIVNETIRELGIPIFSVPRIYSDELMIENENYIDDFLREINKNSQIFFTGKNIVSKNFSSNKKIILEKIKENKIINWDNFYANDYCPKKLFIGPWLNRNLIEKSMINGTGMIETDKLILEIVDKTGQRKGLQLWKKILKKNNIPDQFFDVYQNFLSPNFSFENTIKPLKYNDKLYESLDFLLWKWKTCISREWYPYLLNFKHDLQILNKELSFNRILKTQTNPMQNILKNRRD